MDYLKGCKTSYRIQGDENLGTEQKEFGNYAKFIMAFFKGIAAMCKTYYGVFKGSTKGV